MSDTNVWVTPAKSQRSASEPATFLRLSRGAQGAAYILVPAPFIDAAYLAACDGKPRVSVLWNQKRGIALAFGGAGEYLARATGKTAISYRVKVPTALHRHFPLGPHVVHTTRRTTEGWLAFDLDDAEPRT